MDNENESVVAPKKRRWLLAVVALVVVATVAAAAWWLTRTDTVANEEQTTVNEPVVAESKATATVTKIVDEGVVWQKPEQLGDLGLVIKNDVDSGTEFQGVNYWQMGVKDENNTIVLALVHLASMSDYYERQYFIKIGETYYHLAANSDEISQGSGVASYSLAYSGVVKEGTETFKSLLPDSVIDKGETRLSANEGSWATLLWDDVKELTNKQQVGDTPWGPLYLVKTGKLTDGHTGNDKVVTGADIGQYLIVLNDGTARPYQPRPKFLRDDGTFQVASSKFIANSVYSFASTGGCGTGINKFLIATGQTWQEEQVVGTSAGGSKLYAGVNEQDPAANLAYSIYDYSFVAGVGPKETLTQLISDYGTLFWVDDYGTTLVFQSSKYVPAAECGKPVVYLYPTKTMPVTIQVGAKVRLSNPPYQDGWQVVAYPNGQITVAGQHYPYLFWEGKGNGVYPAINVGQVIASDKAVPTIKSNLAEMGLTTQETANFLEFWAPKLPKTPYVRLTWLTNHELDQLAPLTITPQPDSIIRVFLDFAGLSEPIVMPKQQLPHFKRTGFTAVEWGGLLY